MSLLMEALRKAEQAKQKAAEAAVGAAHHDGGGLPGGAIPGAGEIGPGERGETEPAVVESVADAGTMTPDARLVLEEQEDIVPTPFAADSSAELADSEGEMQSITDRKKGESNGLTLENSPRPDQGLMVEVGMQDVMVVDSPVSPEPDTGLAPDAGIDKDAKPSALLLDAIKVDTPVERSERGNAPAANATQSGAASEARSEAVDLEINPPAIASAESSRQAARTVFAAKKEYQLQGRNRRLLMLGGVGGLVGVGLAAFFFYVYRSMTLPVASTPVVVVEKNITPLDSVATSVPMSGADVAGGGINKELVTSTPDSLSVSTPSPMPKETPSSVSPASSSSQNTPSLSDVAPLPSVSTQVQLSSPVNKRVSAPPANEIGAELPLETVSAPEFLPEKPAPAPIVITHRTTQPQTGPLLTSAYNAYQEGDVPLARNMYQQVLQADPKNRGALLGLASIALQGRETSVARELYLRLLDQDPGDPLARAGMLAISPTGDLAQQESEVKLLLKQYPQSAPLFFSLGNIYAAGQRWSEAQQAYFEALQQAKNSTATGSHASSVSGMSDTHSTVANVPPDYPFNLAISLEHLGQMKPAAKYYKEALQLSAGQPAGFDPEALRTRLQTFASGATP
jgi:hypothetical protein